MKSSRFFLAADPGLGGAIALLNPSGAFLLVEDMPTSRKKSGRNEVDVQQLHRFLDACTVNSVEVCCLIERVSAMPGQGVSGMFSMGDSFGALRAMATAICTRVDYVAPVTWKKKMGLTKDKEYSRTLARRYYPDACSRLERKKDEGRAEALLLARYSFHHHTWE